MLYLILAGLISVTVSPRACFEPCNIRVTLKVEPAKDNERVVVEVYSTNLGYYHRSDMDYTNGQPKTIQITYPGLPAGNYVVKGVLYKHDTKTWKAGEDVQGLNVVRVE